MALREWVSCITKNFPKSATDTLVIPQFTHYTQVFAVDGGKSEGYAYIGLKDSKTTIPFL